MPPTRFHGDTPRFSSPLTRKADKRRKLCEWTRLPPQDGEEVENELNGELRAVESAGSDSFVQRESMGAGLRCPHYSF